jgi:hypothetical protein
MSTVVPFTNINTFKGIDNINNSVSLGKGFLKEANNVDIDDKYNISRRSGYTLQLSGNFHSLFSWNDVLLAVSNNNLVRIKDNFSSYEVLQYNVGNNAMVYTVANDKIFYTNNIIIGYIKNGISKEFEEPVETGRYKLPAGHLIKYYYGRLYVAKGNVVYYSDPMNFTQMRTRSNFIMFNDRITMLETVTDGMYISDNAIRFMQGKTPKEFAIKLLANYTVIEGTAIKIDGSYLNFKQPIEGEVVYMMTENGVAIGMDSGQFINLTHNYYANIKSSKGKCIFKNDLDKKQYLVLLEE